MVYQHDNGDPAAPQAIIYRGKYLSCLPYWLVGQEGAIIRGFHLYPIVIYPGERSINFNGTIDDDLVANLGVTEQEKYLAQNSRELFCCELSLPETPRVFPILPGNSCRRRE